MQVFLAREISRAERWGGRDGSKRERLPKKLMISVSLGNKDDNASEIRGGSLRLELDAFHPAEGLNSSA